MLAECARILMRRRLLVLLALVVAVVAGAAAYSTIKPKQTSSAEVLFLPSSAQPGTAVKDNPFLDVGQSTLTMSFVVQTVVEDSAVARDLAKHGFTAQYTIGPNPVPNAGPTLLVTTESKSAGDSEKTLQAVLSEIAVQLRAKQAALPDVPNKLFITSMVITQSVHATPGRSGQIKGGIVGFLLTALFLVVIILLFDRRRTTRTRKRASLAPGSDQPETPGAPSAASPRHPEPRRAPREPETVAVGPARSLTDNQRRATKRSTSGAR